MSKQDKTIYTKVPGGWDPSRFRAALGRRGITLADLWSKLFSKGLPVPSYSYCARAWTKTGPGPKDAQTRAAIARILKVKISDLS